MARLDEKIAATQFVAHTRLSFAEVVEIGREAAAAAGGLRTSVKEHEVVDGASVTYSVKRVVFGTVMNFYFIYSEDEGGQDNTVVFRVSDGYMTSQAQILMIGVGPKNAIGYGPLERFSNHMQRALDASRQG